MTLWLLVKEKEAPMSKVEQQNFNYLAMQQGPVGNAQLGMFLEFPPQQGTVECRAPCPLSTHMSSF